MSPIYFVIMLLHITIKPATARSSPVLIHGQKLPLRPVFPTIPKDEFREIMRGFVNRFAFFVVLEESFQAHQLSCKRLPLKDCFSPFQNGDYTFYASVENPQEALEGLFERTADVYVDEKGKLRATEVCEQGFHNKLNILRLPKKFESKLTLLEMRAEIMHDILGKLKNCDHPPLFFFTATKSDVIQYKSDGDTIKIEVKAASTRMANNVVITDIFTKHHRIFSNCKAEVKNLPLTILKVPDQYTLINTTYEGIEYKTKLKWSQPFVISEETLFKNGNKLLRLNKLHFDKFSIFENITEPLTYKEDWYTCYYVTPGILMGLFVTAILGIFLYYGITMLLDIRTNDRFDGPKMHILQFSNIEN